MKAKIEIDQKVYHKIMHWIDKSSVEVSGLGKLTLKDGVYRVTSAMLLPQKNGATHTDIEGDAVGKAMFMLKDEPGDLRFWWHSHVNMDVFWSGTDKDTIHKIGQGGWFVSTVFNKRRQMKSAIFISNAFARGGMFSDGESLFVDDVHTEIMTYLSGEEIKEWDAEYDKNVTAFEKKYQQEELTDYNSVLLGHVGHTPNWNEPERKNWKETFPEERKGKKHRRHDHRFFDDHGNPIERYEGYHGRGNPNKSWLDEICEECGQYYCMCDYESCEDCGREDCLCEEVAEHESVTDQALSHDIVSPDDAIRLSEMAKKAERAREATQRLIPNEKEKA